MALQLTSKSRVLAKNFDPFLAATGNEPVPDIRQVFNAGSSDCDELGAQFIRHGSDKATTHDYHHAYAGLLAGRRHEPLRILEIGIGTNNPNAASTMGANGRPGASLRAWRDWGLRFDVHGADVDRNILFSDERITTHWLDQTRPETLAALERLGPFDLVIDDGLHAPAANLNTLAFALKMLKPGGIAVVEDIAKPLTPFWLAIGRLLDSRYETMFLHERVQAIFVVRQRA